MTNGVNIVNKERMEEKKNRLASSLRDNLSKRKTQKKSRIEVGESLSTKKKDTK